MPYYNDQTVVVPAWVEDRLWRPIVNFQTEPKDAPPGSPVWWAWRLSAELLARQPLVCLLEDYYEGRHKLGLSTAEYQRVFGRALAPVSDPWMSLVVRTPAERLEVQGFRLGEGEKLDADKDAWNIWQANDLDEDAQLLFTEAIKLGEAYMLVWKGRDDEVPRITVEHPGQFVVAREPGDRRKIAAAFKVFNDLDGLALATLYLPDRIVRMQWHKAKSRWVARDRGREPAEERNPLGVVPVVPVVNDPQMLPCYPPSALIDAPHNVPSNVAIGLGRSDLADVISTQDQINKLLCDLLVASEFGAHRQRWMTGFDPPEDADGNPQPVEVGASRMLAIPSEDARIGDLGATDLSNYVRPIEQRIQSLAARTRTPPHYLLGQIVNASGDALKAAETGLVAKVKDKQRSFGGSFERAIRLAFRWLDDPRQKAIRAEVDWKDPETRTESEFIDAQVKKLSIGIPVQQLWEDIGYSAQEIERMRGMIRTAALEGALADPLVVNPNGAQPEVAGQS